MLSKPSEALKSGPGGQFNQAVDSVWRTNIPAGAATALVARGTADLFAPTVPAGVPFVPTTNPTVPLPSVPSIPAPVPTGTATGTFNPGAVITGPRPSVGAFKPPAQPPPPTSGLPTRVPNTPPPGTPVSPKPSPNQPKPTPSTFAGSLGGLVLYSGLIGAAIGLGVSALVNVGRGLWDLWHAKKDLNEAKAALAKANEDLAKAQAAYLAAQTPAQRATYALASRRAARAVAAAEVAVDTAERGKPNWWLIAKNIAIDTLIAGTSAALSALVMGLVFGVSALPGGAAGIVIALVIGFAMTVLVKKAVTLVSGHRLDPDQSKASPPATNSAGDTARIADALDEQLCKLDEIAQITRSNQLWLDSLQRAVTEQQHQIQVLEKRAA